MRDILLALGPLLGVVIGGVLAWINGRSQATRRDARERNQLILGKLEELHQLLSDVINYYQCLTFAHARDPNELRKVSNPMVYRVQFDRLEMLVGFYAPELSDDLTAAAKIADEYARPFVELLSDETPDETEVASLPSSLVKHSVELAQIYRKMQKIVIALSKQHL